MNVDNINQGNKDRHFKGQQAHERVISSTRKHWIILLPCLMSFIFEMFFFSLFVYILLRFEFKGISESWAYKIISLCTIIIGMFFIHRFFNKLLNYYLEVTIITSFRIVCVEKSLFISDEKDAIDLHEIQDVKKSQKGIFRNFLDYGSVIIVLSGVNSTRTLQSIPLPDKFFRIINLAKRNYILESRKLKRRKLSNNISIEDRINNIRKKLGTEILSFEAKIK